MIASSPNAATISGAEEPTTETSSAASVRVAGVHVISEPASAMFLQDAPCPGTNREVTPAPSDQNPITMLSDTVTPSAPRRRTGTLGSATEPHQVGLSVSSMVL